MHRLLKSPEQLAAVLNGVADAITAQDHNGRLIYANEAAVNALGYASTEVLLEAAANDLNLPYELLDEAGQPLPDRQVASNTDDQLVRFRIRATGEERWTIVKTRPVYDQDGSLAFIVNIFQDVTERRENEQRTLLLQQLTAALASAVTAEAVADVMAGQVLKALGGHIAAIMQMSSDGQCLEAISVAGIPAAIVNRYTRIPMNAVVPITDAARHQQPVWIENPQDYRARYPEVFQTTQPATNTQAIACLPLIVNHRLIGAFGISFPQPRKMTAADRAFMVALAQQCAQALERARLHVEAQNLAAMNERQRLARDLHDAVSQTLFSASVIAESLPRLWQQSPARTLHLLEQLRLLNRGAMAEMRSLLVELRPEALLNTRLETLLAQLVDTVKVRKPVDITLKINLQARHPLPPDVHIAFYRIAQEALTNVMKHTNATEVVIELNELPRHADLTIQDNGSGFNPRAASSGIGLASMRERAADVKARLRVVSRKGKGTRVSVTWPRH